MPDNAAIWQPGAGNPVALLPALLPALVEVPQPLSAAESDEQIIELWLHGRSLHTQAAYQADVLRLLAFTAKPAST